MAYVAAVELQMNTWPELIPLLLRNVASPESTEQVKEASLEAVGYVCEDLVSSSWGGECREVWFDVQREVDAV